MHYFIFLMQFCATEMLFVLFLSVCMNDDESRSNVMLHLLVGWANVKA